MASQPRSPSQGKYASSHFLPPTMLLRHCCLSCLREPQKESQRQVMGADGFLRSQRTPCTLSLLISAVHRSHTWKNQYWQGQEKGLLKHVCHLRCLQTHSHSSSPQTLFPHHSYLLRPDFLLWADPCVGNGVMEVQGEASERPFSPTPPAWLRSLKPRSE